ncbi:MAG: ribonuclease P protein component [Gallionellaceae bacterium]|nr:ribonuclease P protein component [Gallionellaceae bacterium]MDD5365950.1 ribonuclease P protein component [Gallionellaceae bacterium]
MTDRTPRGLYAFGWDSKLRKTDDFSSVFRFKRVQRGTCLDIFSCQNGLPYSRLGLVVPKKILPRAVDRNRARRILREVFRLSQPRLASLDVIIRVKAAGRDADFRAQWDLFVRKYATKPANAAAQQMNG